MIIVKCGEKPNAPAIAKHWYKNTKAISISESSEMVVFGAFPV